MFGQVCSWLQSMSSSVMEKVAVYTSPGPTTHWTLSKLANGNTLVKGMRVFRAGTFRDSMGIQRTWNIEDLHQMVNNFNALKADLLPNIPVRIDHSWSVEKVVGYFSDMAVENEFLTVDWEATEASAVAKLKSGTYRSRSLEVGLHETNDERFFWPVVQGFAFVDLPAVEGLHRGDKPIACFSAMDYKEPIVPDTAVPVVTPPADTGARPPVVSFRIKGAQVTDPTAVQAHIDTIEAENVALEAFRVETTRMNRHEFVDNLAKANKITQPQVEGLKALSAGLNPDQFTAFKASYEAAPVHPILVDYTNGITNPNGTANGGKDPLMQKVQDLEEQLVMLNRAGVTADKIAASKPAQELAALRAASK